MIRKTMPELITERVEAMTTEELKETLIERSLDALLPNFLRRPDFIRICFEYMPYSLGDGSYLTLSSALKLIEMRKDTGALIFGDMAYLKFFNNVSRDEGDDGIKMIAKAIEVSNFDLIGRFRDGDEFICYSESVAEAKKSCLRVKKLLSGKIHCGLPVHIDIAHVSYAQTARTYLSLLDKKIVTSTENKEGKFFKIALDIAEKRSDITKMLERALLFTELLTRVRDGSMDKVDYDELFDQLTRGGKYIKPEAFWCDMPTEDYSRCALTLTLAKLGDTSNMTAYEKEIAIVAESFFLHSL